MHLGKQLGLKREQVQCIRVSTSELALACWAGSCASGLPVQGSIVSAKVSSGSADRLLKEDTQEHVELVVATKIRSLDPATRQPA